MTEKNRVILLLVVLLPLLLLLVLLLLVVVCCCELVGASGGEKQGHPSPRLTPCRRRCELVCASGGEKQGQKIVSCPMHQPWAPASQPIELEKHHDGMCYYHDALC